MEEIKIYQNPSAPDFFRFFGYEIIDGNHSWRDDGFYTEAEARKAAEVFSIKFGYKISAAL